MRPPLVLAMLVTVANVTSAASFDHLTPLTPTATINLRPIVALREGVKAVIIGDKRISLLISDQGLTGRSGILLETDATVPILRVLARCAPTKRPVVSRHTLVVNGERASHRRSGAISRGVPAQDFAS